MVLQSKSCRLPFKLHHVGPAVCLSSIVTASGHAGAQINSTSCDAWQGMGPGIGLGNDLAIYNGELFACAPFQRWNGASWEPMEGGVNPVAALTVYDGKLIAGGSFNMAGGQPANAIAAWDGQDWHPLGSGMDGPVYELGTYDGQLIAAGEFNEAGGTFVDYVARWDGKCWHPMGDGSNGNATLHSFTVYGGQLYATRSFDVLRWNGSDWETFGAAPNAQIVCLSVYGGELIAGGYFTTMSSEPARRVVRWNGATNDWDPLGSGLGGPFSHVSAVAAYNGDLFAAGRFTTAGGHPASSIARWDGVRWHPLDAGIAQGEQEGQVKALTVYDNQLIIAGGFTAAGGNPASNIARWRDCDLCLADIVDDNQVNVHDLLAVIGSWGQCPQQQPWCAADTVSPNPEGGWGYPDGVVDVSDLIFLINEWGGCVNGCLSDMNDDGSVNTTDLLSLIATWGPCPPPPQPACCADIAPAETGGSGAVDVADLHAVIAGWGPCP